MADKRHFGRYEIIRTLGAGGMGEVLLAKQTGLVERLVVIKKVLPHLARDETFRQRFLDEMRLAASLTHGGIVQVYDFGDIGGELFMAMEFVDGLDLAKVMEHEKKRGGKVPLAVTLCLMIEVAQALGYAHSKCDASGMPLGIVHRDISPQNILLSRDGQIKITDFGVAIATSKSSLTLPGTLHGKVPYMSPEQVSGEEVDSRSDQFSLGVVAYELLAGKRLFEGETEMQIIEAIKRCAVPRLGDVVNDVDKELDAIVMRMLQRDPKARFQSMYDCAEAVKSYATSKGILPSPKVVSDYVKRLCPPITLESENSVIEEHKDFRISEVLRAAGLLVGVSLLVFLLARSFRTSGEKDQRDASLSSAFQMAGVEHPQRDMGLDIVEPREVIASARPLTEVLEDQESRSVKRFVTIRSEPPEADVVLGDKRLGKTPLKIEASKVNLKITKDGYEPRSVSLSSASSGTVTVTLQPIQKGRLRFRYFPADATVMLDGVRLQSNTNLVDIEVIAGDHVLELKSKDGETKTISVKVVSGKVLELGTIEVGK